MMLWILQNDPASADAGPWEWAREPGPLQALVIVLASFVVAKVLDWVLTAVLRSLVQRTRSVLDDLLLQALHGPVVKSVVLFGLGLAAVRLELDPGPLGTTRAGLATLALIIWTVFGFRAVSLFLRAASTNPRRFEVVQPQTFPLFDNLAKLGLFCVAVWIFLQVWDLDATGWIASAGIAGIALGFAAQDTLSNLFAGVLIMLDAPYRVGDTIDLESGQRGVVSHIGLRSTRILTRDDVEITIPNSVMGNAMIVNESAGPTPKHRLRVRVGVAYGSEVPRVRAALLSTTEGNELVCDEPAPRVRFRSFGESGLDFELLCWIQQPEDRGRVLDDLNEKVYDALAREEIEIPFPKRDLYVKELPPGLGAGREPDSVG